MYGRYTIREANPHDAEAIIALLWHLAKYEGMLGDFHPDVFRLSYQLGETKECQLRAFLIEERDRPVGVATFYVGAYGGFSMKWKVCVEDVFIIEQHRGNGLLRKLFTRIAQFALDSRKGQPFPVEEITFMVLDWNEQAITAYQALGAVEVGCVLKYADEQTWTLMSIKGEALKRLAWP